jgi:cell division protease FtsH
MYDGIITQIGVYDQAFVKDLAAKGIDVKIEPEKTWMNVLVGTLPFVLIFGVWLFFLRQMQGGPKGVFSFGKSKAKLIAENSQKVTFADVAGVPEAKEELQEIIEFLKDPRKFQRLGGKIPKGALLFGPPGTGKTLLARAVAGEAGVPFFSMSGSDFVEMFVGVGASRVRDLFEQGKSNAPCIIFIDEIDAVGRQRGAGIGGGHDEREQTLNQLLVEMDGFESNDGVILIAATNRPDVLDPALLRPGRFDRQIVVDWPDVKARAEILKVHARKIQLDQYVDLDSIAKGTPGMTGADLANVVNEAALLAARLNRKRVTMADFEEAKDKVMMGAARKTLVITEEEKKLTAYHEAGHVLVSKHVPGSDPVHKVSIVARGRALGLTHFLPQDERHNWSFKYCMDKMAVLLGGRAAEMVRFGDITNGAANDIERATDLARKMVCEWGMSKRLGPLTFGKKEQEIFLGRDIATHKDYSEQTSVAIDQEIRKYVETAQQRAESIILEHTEKLEALTAEILKKEVLSGDEIDSILNGESPARKRKPKPAAEPAAKTAVLAEAPAETPAIGSGAPRSSRRRRGSRSRKRGQETQGERIQDSGDTVISPEPADSVRTAPDVKPAGEKNAAAVPETAPAAPEKGKPADIDKAAMSEPETPAGKKGKKGGDSENRTASVFRTRRSRMVHLKTGGRRRFIKKAPAQKVREIN